MIGGQLRQLLDAGLAPRGPEVDDDDLPREVGRDATAGRGGPSPRRASPGLRTASQPSTSVGGASAEPASGARTRKRRATRVSRTHGASRDGPSGYHDGGGAHGPSRRSHPHRERHLRPDPGAGRPALGSADPALARALPDLRRADAARPRARPRPREEGGRPRPRRARRPRRRQGRGHRGGGRRGAGRPVGRRVPARGLADRQRHPDEHERQRGPGQPRQRDPRRGAGREAPRPPQRRREPGPVHERRLPHRDPRGHGRGLPARRHPRGRAPARRARRRRPRPSGTS